METVIKRQNRAEVMRLAQLLELKERSLAEMMERNCSSQARRAPAPPHGRAGICGDAAGDVLRRRARPPRGAREAEERMAEGGTPAAAAEKLAARRLRAGPLARLGARLELPRAGVPSTPARARDALRRPAGASLPGAEQRLPSWRGQEGGGSSLSACSRNGASEEAEQAQPDIQRSRTSRRMNELRTSGPSASSGGAWERERWGPRSRRWRPGRNASIRTRRRSELLASEERETKHASR